MVKHDKEAEIKIVEKKTSGLVTAMDYALVATTNILWSDQRPASSSTADATQGRKTSATTKQHTTERLVCIYIFSKAASVITYTKISSNSIIC